MDSKNIRELNLEEMDKVSGGATKTVMTRSATVRSGAGSNYPVTGTLKSGTAVNFTGTVNYNSQEGRSWCYISSPVSGWVPGHEIGINT